MKNNIPKEEQKQHLIDMMKQDEELGLYDEQLRKQFSANVEGSKEFNEMCKEEQTKCYCGHTITCDCGPEQEIKLEEVFNDEKKENIKKFIDEINNPSQPNQALKDAAEKLKGKELFKESNDRARKILSEIKSLPIQETLEEAIKREYETRKFNSDFPFDPQSFKLGAKWQQERMYSEEEVIGFGEFIFKHSLLTHIRGVKSLFEQFKKK